ncbi:MAG TPA: mobile mystery protein A [Saprospiraceae bacterium]|nr:mobile mystery protein A [Saprospiraceae bacterium]
MSTKSLQKQQLNNKMLGFASLKQVAIPPTGWIKAIRTALGMTLQQLGNRLNISKQGVLDIENREKEGAITLKALQEVAKAMNMQLVYGFVPNDGSLDALIERRAREVAIQIVQRTAQTMQLEDQANSKKRIEAAINEKTEELKKEVPKMLWD